MTFNVGDIVYIKDIGEAEVIPKGTYQYDGEITCKMTKPYIESHVGSVRYVRPGDALLIRSKPKPVFNSGTMWAHVEDIDNKSTCGYLRFMLTSSGKIVSIDSSGDGNVREPTGIHKTVESLENDPYWERILTFGGNDAR